jgi:hypothetical protein
VTELLDERQGTLRFVDDTCPRCGSRRAWDQRFCLDCGEPLPKVTGRVAALRRRWIRRVGWYPGDWVWLALAGLLVAAAGAAAAIAVAHHRHAGTLRVITALSSLPVAEPSAVPVATVTVATGKLPTAPEPTKPAAKPGRAVWPAGQTGWTIVLVSYPKTTGRQTATQTALEAAHHGLSDVGVLDSSRYPSLQPGYFVVFSGIYPTESEANAAVASAHQAGFGAAYSRQIAG